MIVQKKLLSLLALWLGFFCWGSSLLAQQPASNSPIAAPLSSTAEQIYAEARPQLLQIRTLLKGQAQSSIGSGFLVGAEGLIMTNYHVISQFALEPDAYQLEYLATDGSKGDLTLHALDITSDLAVLRMTQPPPSNHWFQFSTQAVQGKLPKGERLFAMGNPFDIGFTIVEGTYNGMVENSYQPRIHFTGALNSGMSGGPAVNMQREIAGVNVAKKINGDLVSFLVPAADAHALLEKARNSPIMTAEKVRQEITLQLTDWQQIFTQRLNQAETRKVIMGSYQVQESSAPWFKCWSYTNGNQRPRPKTTIRNTVCDTGSEMFITQGVSSGSAMVKYAYLQSNQLNSFQFAANLSENVNPGIPGQANRYIGKQQCSERFVQLDKVQPPMYVTWCARSYRDFVGLYDMNVTAVTQDHSQEALVAEATLTGVSYANAMAFTRAFLKTIEVTK